MDMVESFPNEREFTGHVVFAQRVEMIAFIG